jgi:signal transduction histidine kinase
MQPAPEDSRRTPPPGTPDGLAASLLLGATPSAGKATFAALTLALVAVIGFIDYLTGSEISMLLFYIAPVSLAVVTVNRTFAMVTGALSVAAWLAGDMILGTHYKNPLAHVWNGSVALCTYLVVAWLLDALVQLRRDLERRVNERTAALQLEIAERVRLENILLETSERERKAIGRDLHDGLCQHLTGTALVAKVLQSKLGQQGSGEASEAGHVVDLVEQGIEQTRSLAKGLLLPEIGRRGLSAALDEFAASIRRQGSVAIDVDCPDSIDLGESGPATHLYRIAEEAARNALRHARPSHVTITVIESDDHVLLEVQDDGRGFDASVAPGKGLGLRIMQHRAALIGAEFGVSPAEGRGTRVFCSLPRRAPAGDHPR